MRCRWRRTFWTRSSAAKLPIGTIYQYFADKDQIFDALIRREIGALVRLLESIAWDPEESLAESLRRLLHSLVRARPDAPVLYRSLEQVAKALFRQRVGEARGSVIAWVRAFLDSHGEEIGVRDLDAAAFVIVAAAEGVAVTASPEFYRTRAADELAMLFTRYLIGGKR